MHAYSAITFSLHWKENNICGCTLTRFKLALLPQDMQKFNEALQKVPQNRHFQQWRNLIGICTFATKLQCRNLMKHSKRASKLAFPVLKLNLHVCLKTGISAVQIFNEALQKCFKTGISAMKKFNQSFARKLPH